MLPLLTVAGVVMVAACGGGDDDDTAVGVTAVIDPGDGGEYQPDLVPEDVVAAIDNPYLPLAPGRDGSTRASPTARSNTSRSSSRTAPAR